MRITCVAILLIMVIVIAGCEDNVINNYLQPETSAIFGNVSPVDSGIVRAIGDKIYESRLNSAGFFHIGGLTPGYYRLEIYPENHSKRVLPNLNLFELRATELRNVTISKYPYPIYRTDPADSAIGVAKTSLLLYVDERLDLESLNAGSHIEPSATGTWLEVGAPDSGIKSGNPVYRLELSDPTHELRPQNAEFLVTIDSSVRTKAGALLGKSLFLTFTSKPLTANARIESTGDTVSVSLDNFSPMLAFSDCVNVDSVARAVRFVPHIPGIWIRIGDSRSYPCDDESARNFRFLASLESLSPNTSYQLIISDQIILNGVARFPVPDTTFFTTESYGVSEVYPPNGSTRVPEWLKIGAKFNTFMDTVSVREAFSVQELGGEAIQGEFRWNIPLREFVFFTSTGLLSGRVYKIAITTAAKTESGVQLEDDFESYFQTE